MDESILVKSPICEGSEIMALKGVVKFSLVPIPFIPFSIKNFPVLRKMDFDHSTNHFLDALTKHLDQNNSTQDKF